VAMADVSVWIQRKDEPLMGYAPTDGVYMAEDERPRHALAGFLKRWDNVYDDPYYWGWPSDLAQQVSVMGVEIFQSFNRL
jgi:hypothetical protein